MSKLKSFVIWILVAFLAVLQFLLEVLEFVLKAGPAVIGWLQALVNWAPKAVTAIKDAIVKARRALEIVQGKELVVKAACVGGSPNSDAIKEVLKTEPTGTAGRA